MELNYLSTSVDKYDLQVTGLAVENRQTWMQ